MHNKELIFKAQLIYFKKKNINLNVFTMFFKTQNIVQMMHLTMLIAHPIWMPYICKSILASVPDLPPPASSTSKKEQFNNKGFISTFYRLLSVTGPEYNNHLCNHLPSFFNITAEYSKSRVGNQFNKNPITNEKHLMLFLQKTI